MSKTLGQWVKEHREARGMRTGDLARAIGHDKPSYISQLEAGRIGLPSPETRRQLAKALGVSHLDVLIAAGEIDADEVTDAGAVPIVQTGPLESEVIEMIRGISWNENRTELVRRIFHDLFEGAPR